MAALPDPSPIRKSEHLPPSLNVYKKRKEKETTRECDALEGGQEEEH